MNLDVNLDKENEKVNINLDCDVEEFKIINRVLRQAGIKISELEKITNQTELEPFSIPLAMRPFIKSKVQEWKDDYLLNNKEDLGL